MEYDVIISCMISCVIKEVNNFISKGWQPIGGITENSDGLYMQAIIKKEETK